MPRILDRIALLCLPVLAMGQAPADQPPPSPWQPTRVFLGTRWYEAKHRLVSAKVFGDGWPLKAPVANLICIPALKSGGQFVIVPLFKGATPAGDRAYSVSGWSRMVGDGRKLSATVPQVFELPVRHLFEGPDWNGAPIGELMKRLDDAGCYGTPPVDQRP